MEKPTWMTMLVFSLYFMLKMYIYKIKEKFENSIAKYYIANYNEFKNS